MLLSFFEIASSGEKKKKKKKKNEVENGGKERKKGPQDCFRIYNNAGLYLV